MNASKDRTLSYGEGLSGFMPEGHPRCFTWIAVDHMPSPAVVCATHMAFLFAQGLGEKTLGTTRHTPLTIGLSAPPGDVDLQVFPSKTQWCGR